jgi:hypothetical protein
VTNPDSWIDDDDDLQLEPVICDPWLAKGSLKYARTRDFHEMVVDIDDYKKHYVANEVRLLLRAGKKAGARDDIHIRS